MMGGLQAVAHDGSSAFIEKSETERDAAVRYTKLLLPLLHHEIVDFGRAVGKCIVLGTNSFILFRVPGARPT